MNEDQAPRQNRDGHPCPPWCEVDHEKPVTRAGLLAGHHVTRVPVIEAGAGYVHASACQDGFSADAPQIALSARRTHGSVLVGVRYAENLAVIIEQLATATPDQHRELAAVIRQAAADITGTEARP